jgi:hemerythrin
VIDAGELWNEGLSVGIEQIDDHHRTLIRLMLECREAVDSDFGREWLKETLAALVSYSKYHFLAEERIMYEAGYPLLSAQREAHGEFSDRLAEVVSRNFSDRQALNRELFTFLKDWFVNHIMKQDALIGAFLRGEVGEIDDRPAPP